MAKRLVPSRQALDEMNDSRNRKATQLATTYSNMGGTNTALVPNFAQNNPAPSASIPVLENAVLDKANELQNQSRRLMPNRDTQIDTSNVSLWDALSRGATGIGRVSSHNTLQQNANAINEVRNDRTERILNSIGQTSLAPLTDGTVMGVSVGNGGLTPEMRQAGLTQADLDLFNNTQNEREVGKASRQIAEDHPVLASLGAVAVNPISAATNVTRNLDNYIRGNALQNYVNPATEMRQTVSEGIDSGVGRFAYNVGNSAADMLTAMLMPGSAAGTMGLEKASEVINGAVDRGLTPDQILAEGIGSGVTTAATEAIPLGRFSQGGNIFGAMLAEGLQEGAEDYADTILDQLVTRLGSNADKSELALQLKDYIDAGYSVDDAVKAVMLDYNKQVGLDVLAGGITGGLMGAGSNAIQGRNIITGRERTNNQNIVDDIKSDVENLKSNVTEEAYNTLIDKIDDAAEQHPELIPQLKEIVSEMETLPDSIRNEIAAQNAQTIPNLMLEEQAVQDRRNEEQALLEQGMQMRNQEINAIAEEITAEKNRVLDAIENNDPLSGEEIYNFAKYIDYMSRQNPDMAGYLNAELNDVLGMSGNWLTDFDNATVEIPTVLPEDARAEVQTAENGAVIDQANSIINSFAQDIQNGVDRQTAYRGVIGELTNLGNAYPNVRAELNNLVRNRLNPLMANPTNEVGNIPTIQNEVQSVQPEAQSDRLTRRQITEYRSQRDAIKSNLAMFKGTKKLQNRLDKAFSAIEQNQPNAVENFNNVVNEINEEMAGETVGVSQRDVMSDLYRDMKEVTDGYKIRVSKDAIRQLGLSNDTYNELKNRLYTGKNSITFVEKGGTPIDSAYMEMYDQAHGSLPSPQNMAEGDLLKALYKYITDAKSSRNETTMETAWEDIPVSDNRSDTGRKIDDIVDDMYDKIDDGTATAEDLNETFDKMNEISRKNPELRDMLVDRFLELRKAFNENEKVMNADVHDPDIENAQSIEELEDILDEELDSEELIMEIPREHNQTAGVRTGRFKQSRVFTNTGIKGGNVPRKVRNLDKKYGNMQYENNTEEESMAEAQKHLDEKGIGEETRRLMHKDGWTNVDADEFMMIYHDAVNYAKSLDAEGKDSNEAWGYAYDLFEKIKEEGSRAGQALQAYAKWSRSNTAEGLLAEAMSIIKKVADGETLDYGSHSVWDRDVAKETMRATQRVNDSTTGKRGRRVSAVDIDFMRNFLTEASKLNEITDGTRYQELIENGVDPKVAQRQINHEYKLIYDSLGKMVNNQIPAQLGERIRTYLMDSMLGNARTLLTRNAGGNIGFNLMEQLLRKPLSALIDKGVSKVRNSARTQTVSKEGYKAWLNGAADAFSQEAYDFKHGTHSSRSGEVNLANAVMQNRNPMKTFNDSMRVEYDDNGNAKFVKDPATYIKESDPKALKAAKKGLKLVGEFFNKADNLVKYGLSVGDRWAYEGAYLQTMAELEQMYNSGMLDQKYTNSNGDVVTERMSREEFEEYAKDNAMMNGLESCYQDDSKMAQSFLAARKFINNLSQAIFGVDILSQFAMPFAKTPANIIQRAIEYSPLGLVKNAVQTIREVSNPNTDLNQRRFSTETSRNIIGSVLFGLGILAARSGALTGGYSDDADKRQAEKEAGMQEYALHHPFGLEADVDIGWLPVLGNDLVAAAAFQDAYANHPELTMGQRLGQGLSSGLQTQFQTSALQGLSRFVGGSGSFSSNDEGNIVKNAKDTLFSGATQFIPSLLRQTANATDPYQRQLAGYNPDDYYANSVRSAIPGLRQDLEPKIGRTGEELEQNHARTTAGQWFNSFLNPATVTYGTPDAVRDEAMRLFDATQDNRAFQSSVTRNELKVDDHIPTDQEFTEYQRNAYSAMNEAAQELIQSEEYSDMTDMQRVNMLAQLYSSIKSVEKLNTLDLDKSGLDGPEKAYDEGGVDGLLDYLIGSDILRQFDISNNEDAREAALNLLDTHYMSDIPEMVEEYKDTVASTTDRAISAMDNYQNVFSGLSAEDRTALEDEIRSAIASVEGRNALGRDLSTLSGAAKAYAEGGIDALNEYVLARTALSQMGMANNASNREHVMETLNEGGEDAVQQLIQASQVFGEDTNLTYKYDHATNYLPTLSPEQFQSTWNAINADGNTSIKIDELIDYLNRNPGAYDANTALQFWNAFYTGTSAKIPVLVDGQWVARNP